MAHRHPPRHERIRHRGPCQGGRQPAQLRDGEIFRQRGSRRRAASILHGPLREGGDPDLHLARLSQYRPGGDLHRRHGHLHAARGPRRRPRHAHRRRFRHDQRHPDAALFAAQFHGHGLSRDQTGPDRHRDHVRAAARARRDHRPARAPSRFASTRARSNSRTCLSPTIPIAADPEGCQLRGAGGQDGGDRRAFRRRQVDDLAHPVPLL